MSASRRFYLRNERRQSYENRPYGMAAIVIDEMLWPEGHPYRWPTIGHMEDLSAASHEDVVNFFTTYYAPNNASLVIAGDIDPDRTQALVEKWFGEIPRGAIVPPIAPPPARLTEVKRHTDEEIERLRREPPAAREVERAVNQIEASFYRRMARVSGFGGKADQLNAYFFAGGGPDHLAEDLARYRSLSPSDVQAAVLQWLPRDRRVELIVEPEAAR